MTKANTSVRLAAGGRIVIPAPIRNAMRLEEGDLLNLDLQDGSLKITSRREALRRAQELVRSLPGYDPNKSMADELLAERRAEARREEM